MFLRTFAARMECLDQLKIDLKGLKSDVEERHITLNDAYFEAIEATEVRRGSVVVDVTIHRMTEAAFELLFHIAGAVFVPCDLCLDDMEQAISGEQRLIVKFGKSYSEEDEVIVVDENEGMLDATWLVYETIALAIPVRHVHAPGKCNAAMTEKLKEFSTARSSEAEGNQAVDPRWSALSKLKLKE